MKTLALLAALLGALTIASAAAAPGTTETAGGADDFIAQLAQASREHFGLNLARKRRLFQLADAAGVAELPAALDHDLRRQPQGRGRDFDTVEEAAILLDAWTRREPRAALAWAQARTWGDSENSPVGQVLAVWSEDDPAGALAAAFELASPARTTPTSGPPPGTATWSRLWLHPTIWDNYVQRDPAAAAEALSRLSVGGETLRLYARLFQRWGSRDGPAAVAAAERLPADRFRTRAVAAAVRGWIAGDPAGALGWLRLQPAGEERDRALAEGIPLLAAQDPAAAVAALAQITSPAQQTASLVPLAAGWAARDPGAALAWLATKLQGDALTAARRSLVERLARTSPAVAEKVFDALTPPPPVNAIVIGQIAQVKAFANMEAAYAWANALPATGEPYVHWRQAALRYVLDVLSSQDPPRALALAAELVGAEGTDRGHILDRWVRRDPAAALAWLEAQPPGPGQFMLVRFAVTALADTDHPAALAHAPRILAASPWMSEAQREELRALLRPKVVRNYFNPITIEYARQFADAPEEAKAVLQVARSWIPVDPFSAYQWLHTAQAGPERDRIVGIWARYYGNLNAAGAFAWLMSMHDAEIRQSALLEFLEEVASANPDLALRVIAEAGLPPADAATLREQLEEMKARSSPRAEASHIRLPIREFDL